MTILTIFAENLMYEQDIGRQRKENMQGTW